MTRNNKSIYINTTLPHPVGTAIEAECRQTGLKLSKAIANAVEYYLRSGGHAAYAKMKANDVAQLCQGKK